MTIAVVAPKAVHVIRDAKPRSVTSHPPYGEMVRRAVKELKERKGSSRQAITKFVRLHYKVDEKAKHHIRRALVTGVKAGKLVQTKGSGASGSFRLPEKSVKPKSVHVLKSAKRSPTLKGKKKTVKRVGKVGIMKARKAQTVGVHKHKSVRPRIPKVKRARVGAVVV
ncbi:unnamed protein product [Calicophoron daubneyi]|uniref:H15 domain-containing protein n=1 Tax=Calicophoron daubneyi TaxID=300641 RepID=A0AAV2TSK3_CALDB